MNNRWERLASAPIVVAVLLLLAAPHLPVACAGAAASPSLPSELAGAPSDAAVLAWATSAVRFVPGIANLSMISCGSITPVSGVTTVTVPDYSERVLNCNVDDVGSDLYLRLGRGSRLTVVASAIRLRTIQVLPHLSATELVDASVVINNCVVTSVLTVEGSSHALSVVAGPWSVHRVGVAIIGGSTLNATSTAAPASVANVSAAAVVFGTNGAAATDVRFGVGPGSTVRVAACTSVAPESRAAMLAPLVPPGARDVTLVRFGAVVVGGSVDACGQTAPAVMGVSVSGYTGAAEGTLTSLAAVDFAAWVLHGARIEVAVKSAAAALARASSVLGIAANVHGQVNVHGGVFVVHNASVVNLTHASDVGGVHGSALLGLTASGSQSTTLTASGVRFAATGNSHIVMRLSTSGSTCDTIAVLGVATELVSFDASTTLNVTVTDFAIAVDESIVDVTLRPLGVLRGAAVLGFAAFAKVAITATDVAIDVSNGAHVTLTQSAPPGTLSQTMVSLGGIAVQTTSPSAVALGNHTTTVANSSLTYAFTGSTTNVSSLLGIAIGTDSATNFAGPMRYAVQGRRGQLTSSIVATTVEGHAVLGIAVLSGSNVSAHSVDCSLEGSAANASRVVVTATAACNAVGVLGAAAHGSGAALAVGGTFASGLRPHATETDSAVALNVSIDAGSSSLEAIAIGGLAAAAPSAAVIPLNMTVSSFVFELGVPPSAPVAGPAVAALNVALSFAGSSRAIAAVAVAGGIATFSGASLSVSTLVNSTFGHGRTVTVIVAVPSQGAEAVTLGGAVAFGIGAVLALPRWSVSTAPTMASSLPSIPTRLDLQLRGAGIGKSVSVLGLAAGTNVAPVIVAGPWEVKLERVMATLAAADALYAAAVAGIAAREYVTVNVSRVHLHVGSASHVSLKFVTSRATQAVSVLAIVANLGGIVGVSHDVNVSLTHSSFAVLEAACPNPLMAAKSLGVVGIATSVANSLVEVGNDATFRVSGQSTARLNGTSPAWGAAVGGIASHASKGVTIGGILRSQVSHSKAVAALSGAASDVKAVAVVGVASTQAPATVGGRVTLMVLEGSEVELDLVADPALATVFGAALLGLAAVDSSVVRLVRGATLEAIGESTRVLFRANVSNLDALSVMGAVAERSASVTAPGMNVSANSAVLNGSFANPAGTIGGLAVAGFFAGGGGTLVALGASVAAANRSVVSLYAVAQLVEGIAIAGAAGAMNGFVNVDGLAVAIADASAMAVTCDVNSVLVGLAFAGVACSGTGCNLNATSAVIDVRGESNVTMAARFRATVSNAAGVGVLGAATFGWTRLDVSGWSVAVRASSTVRIDVSPVRTIYSLALLGYALSNIDANMAAMTASNGTIAVAGGATVAALINVSRHVFCLAVLGIAGQRVVGINAVGVSVSVANATFVQVRFTASSSFAVAVGGVASHRLSLGSGEGTFVASGSRFAVSTGSSVAFDATVTGSMSSTAIFGAAFNAYTLHNIAGTSVALDGSSVAVNVSFGADSTDLAVGGIASTNDGATITADDVTVELARSSVTVTVRAGSGIVLTQLAILGATATKSLNANDFNASLADSTVSVPCHVPTLQSVALLGLAGGTSASLIGRRWHVLVANTSVALVANGTAVSNVAVLGVAKWLVGVVVADSFNAQVRDRSSLALEVRATGSVTTIAMGGTAAQSSSGTGTARMNTGRIAISSGSVINASVEADTVLALSVLGAAACSANSGVSMPDSDLLVADSAGVSVVVGGRVSTSVAVLGATSGDSSTSAVVSSTTFSVNHATIHVEMRPTLAWQATAVGGFATAIGTCSGTAVGTNVVLSNATNVTVVATEGSGNADIAVAGVSHRGGGVANAENFAAVLSLDSRINVHAVAGALRSLAVLGSAGVSGNLDTDAMRFVVEQRSSVTVFARNQGPDVFPVAAIVGAAAASTLRAAGAVFAITHQSTLDATVFAKTVGILGIASHLATTPAEGASANVTSFSRLNVTLGGLGPTVGSALSNSIAVLGLASTERALTGAHFAVLLRDAAVTVMMSSVNGRTGTAIVGIAAVGPMGLVSASGFTATVMRSTVDVVSVISPPTKSHAGFAVLGASAFESNTPTQSSVTNGVFKLVDSRVNVSLSCSGYVRAVALMGVVSHAGGVSASLAHFDGVRSNTSLLLDGPASSVWASVAHFGAVDGDESGGKLEVSSIRFTARRSRVSSLFATPTQLIRSALLGVFLNAPYAYGGGLTGTTVATCETVVTNTSTTAPGSMSAEYTSQGTAVCSMCGFSHNQSCWDPLTESATFTATRLQSLTLLPPTRTLTNSGLTGSASLPTSVTISATWASTSLTAIASRHSASTSHTAATQSAATPTLSRSASAKPTDTTTEYKTSTRTAAASPSSTPALDPLRTSTRTREEASSWRTRTQSHSTTLPPATVPEEASLAPTATASLSHPHRAVTTTGRLSGTATDVETVMSPTPPQPAGPPGVSPTRVPTLTIVPRTPPEAALPIPVVQQVADATGYTATSTTTVSSLAGGNPAVATQTSRISALRAILACHDGEDEQSANTDTAATGNGTMTPPTRDTAAADEVPDWSEHPLRFGLGVAGATQQYHAGLIVGDIAFTAAFTVVVVAVVAPLRLLVSKSKSYDYGRALGWCRFPGILSVPVALFVPPIAHSAAVCAASFAPDVTVAARAIGGLGILVALLVPAACLGAFRALFHRHFAWTVNGVEVDDAVFPGKPPTGAAVPPAGRQEAETEAAVRPRGPATTSGLLATAVTSRITAMILTEDREWLSRDRGRTGVQMRRFGMFFDVYRGRAPWFFVVELGFAVFVSFLTGLHEAFGCSPIAWTAAAGYVVLTATYVILRPHAVLLDRVIYTSLAFTQACASVLVAAVVELSMAHGRDAPATVRARDAGSFFLSVISMSAAAAGLYELFKVVYQQWLVLHRERRRREAAERRLLDDDDDEMHGGGGRSAALLLLHAGDDDADAPAALALQDEEGKATPEEFCEGAAAATDAPASAAARQLAPSSQQRAPRVQRPPHAVVAADHWLTDGGYVPPGYRFNDGAAADGEGDDDDADDDHQVGALRDATAVDRPLSEDSPLTESRARQAAEERLARIRKSLGAEASKMAAERATSRINRLAKLPPPPPPLPPASASHDSLDALLGEPLTVGGTATSSSQGRRGGDAGVDIDLDALLDDTAPSKTHGTAFDAL